MAKKAKKAKKTAKKATKKVAKKAKSAVKKAAKKTRKVAKKKAPRRSKASPYELPAASSRQRHQGPVSALADRTPRIDDRGCRRDIRRDGRTGSGIQFCSRPGRRASALFARCGFRFRSSPGNRMNLNPDVFTDALVSFLGEGIPKTNPADIPARIRSFSTSALVADRLRHSHHPPRIIRDHLRRWLAASQAAA